MASPFVAEITMFGGNFAPRGWALCNGQLLTIAQNTALFSLLGTTYGGNGQTTFALPNLQGRVPMHPGQGTGLSNRYLGEPAGSSSVTLLSAQMPAHTHSTTAGSGTAANSPSPAGRFPATPASGTPYANTANASMYPAAIGPADGMAGGNLPHNNLMPGLTVTFIIALQGIYPPRG